MKRIAQKSKLNPIFGHWPYSSPHSPSHSKSYLPNNMESNEVHVRFRDGLTAVCVATTLAFSGIAAEMEMLKKHGPAARNFSWYIKYIEGYSPVAYGLLADEHGSPSLII
ncbi:MAG: hypothetical protein Q8O31_08710 [Rhodocyclaceae bacterium]|nr:hypothetical protein [Rhodocyclaceae bacterium]